MTRRTSYQEKIKFSSEFFFFFPVWVGGLVLFSNFRLRSFLHANEHE